MFFTVHVREENHRPVVRVGQLVRENGDTLRIANNAEEWHRRYRDFAKQANMATADAIGRRESYKALESKLVMK